MNFHTATDIIKPKNHYFCEVTMNAMKNNLAGDGMGGSIVNLTKTSLNLLGTIHSANNLIKEEKDAIDVMSTLINSYGGIDNLNKAIENLQKELETSKTAKDENKTTE